MCQEYHAFGRPRRTVEDRLCELLGDRVGRWLGQLIGPRDSDRLTSYELSPLLAGDPAAVPVLRELLHAPDCKARRVAATGLEAIGPEAPATVPSWSTSPRRRRIMPCTERPATQVGQQSLTDT